MDNSSLLTPQEQPVATATRRSRFTIGLPLCSDPAERRFPLTPEGAKSLTERGFAVKIEAGAAADIHYADNAYTRCGVEVTSRDETLRCDIVIHMAPLAVADIRRMRRGAMLLTLLHLDSLTAETIRELQEMSIIAIAVDRIVDEHGNFPFADILAEIDGRAAIATASSLLADPERGKGILLGGIAGINPCEVAIIGSGITAMAAARSACGLGSIVRMFDDDVYSLRTAVRYLGPQVIGSVLHEKVLDHALQSADVVIATRNFPRFEVGANEVDRMKRGVVIFDLSGNPGQTFPSVPTKDLATARNALSLYSDKRVCYVNAGSAVPRTAAMALSNTFNTMLDSVITLNGTVNAINFTPGLRRGVFMFRGKVTMPEVAEIAAIRPTDINFLIQLS